MPPIAVTTCDPAGIGPELCLRLLADHNAATRLHLIGDFTLLQNRAQELAATPAADALKRGAAIAKKALAEGRATHLAVAKQTAAGKPSPRNANHVLDQLRRAVSGCLSGEFAAMVTAPISKEMILAAGIPFVGQTEFIAQECNAPHPVMVLAAPEARVALATTHLPLRAVPDAITPELLQKTLDVLHRDLPRIGAATPPVIAVCALNPHAGEGGHIGDEDQRIITPAVAAAQARGIRAMGPFSADTMLATVTNARADCALAMYHDQGLPAIKARDFARTVNITLGLPFLRASPDHGTAFDIADQGSADDTSMRRAVAVVA